MTSRYDAWKLGLDTDYFDGNPEYDYSKFRGLPCVFAPALKRWRDVETGAIVSEEEAIERNDKECARQTEIDFQMANDRDRGGEW